MIREEVRGMIGKRRKERRKKGGMASKERGDLGERRISLVGSYKIEFLVFVLLSGSHSNNCRLSSLPIMKFQIIKYLWRSHLLQQERTYAGFVKSVFYHFKNS